MHNAPPAFAELRRQEAIIRPGPMMRVAATKQLAHILNIREQLDKQSDPDLAAFVEMTDMQQVLCIPMLKDDEVIGIIVVYRNEVLPFTDKQIALVQNFAAQAVIALENARLLKELRERTEQLVAQSQQLTELNQHLEQRVADQVVKSSAWGGCDASCPRRSLI